MHDYFGKPISVYTAADALEDGVLVDAGPLASELFTWPVLFTYSAWADCVSWCEGDTARTGVGGQSQAGRLWDALWAAFVGIRQELRTARTHGPFSFELYRVDRNAACGTEAEVAATPIRLKATPSINDDGSPLLLISQPEED